MLLLLSMLAQSGHSSVLLCATGGAETGHTERHREMIPTLGAADEELGSG